MNKKTLLLILFVTVSYLLPQFVLADQPCDTIKAFRDVFIQVGSAIVVIGWIITGILYLTAGGAPEKMGTAKKALVACVIGTALIIIAPIAYDFVNGALKLGGKGAGACP